MSRLYIVLLLLVVLFPCCAVRHATGEKLYPEEDGYAATVTIANIDSTVWKTLAFVWTDTNEWKQDFGDIALYQKLDRERQGYSIRHRPSQDTLLGRFIEREFFKTSLVRYSHLTAPHKTTFVRELLRLIEQQRLNSPYCYMAYWLQARLLYDRHQYADASRSIDLAIAYCCQVHEHRDLARIYALAASIAACQGDWRQSYWFADQAMANDIVQTTDVLYHNMPVDYAVAPSAMGDTRESYMLSTYESLIHFYNNDLNLSYDPQHEELLEQGYFHRCLESFKRLPLSGQFGFIAHADSLVRRYSMQSPYKVLFDLCVASYNDSIWNLDTSCEIYQQVHERAKDITFPLLTYTDSLALHAVPSQLNRLRLLQGDSAQSRRIEDLDSTRVAAHRKISARLWMEDYPDYLLGYYEAAMAQYHQHNEAVADSLLEVYFSLCEHPDTAMILIGLPEPVIPIEPALNVYCRIGAHIGETELLSRLSRYCHYQTSDVVRYILSLPELERDYAWNRMVGQLNHLHNAALLHYQSPSVAEAVYDNALHTRTLALSSSLLMDRIDSLPLSQRRDSLLLLNTFRWQDVAHQLDSTQAAIEVVMARPMDEPNGEAMYYAAVLSGRSVGPQVVRLCSVSALDSLLQPTLHGNAQNIDALYTWQLLGAQLYDLCFAHIEPYLEGIETVSIAPTGIFNQLNINAIPCSEKGRLMDRYRIRQVSTTAEMPAFDTGVPPGNTRTIPFATACIYGGLDYYAHTDAPSPASAQYRDYRDGLLYLANSGREADTISQILDSHGCKTLTYQGTAGTEHSVKALDGRAPQLLHFATHSFYLGDDTLRQGRLSPSVESLSRKMRPLRYTGLHLAGSAPAWYGQATPDGEEDGLLTAEEIAQLDLSQTRLAVLSACSSGLGKIDEVDGVIGLQRAFKRAGVQSLLMSLWPVPDDATKLLMQYFYADLMTGVDCHQALTHAMQSLRHDTRYEKPHYWAGFIVLD